MNKSLHRVVFSRRHGMRIAVAEHVRAAGKCAGGGCAAPARAAPAVAGGAVVITVISVVMAALAAWVGTAGLSAAQAQAQPPQAPTRAPVTFASRLPTPQFKLPQPYTSLMRDPAGRGFATPVVGSGSTRWTVDGKVATFDQGSVERVLLNWQSFDIGEGYTVRFLQDKDPAKYVSALNRVWGDNPSVIQGQLLADREVILVNSQGVHFGRGARVQAGKFVASTLAPAAGVFERGLRNVTDASAVFSTAAADSYRNTDLNSAISLEAGAEITTAAGGDVLLIAPRVVNQGRIDTPAGQTILAAGDKVYLMSSSDPRQRGLIVAVDPIKLPGTNSNDPELGSVENAAIGSYKTVAGATVADSTPDNTSGLVARLNEIRADSGSVNLVGLTVRQHGQVNATTAVKGANGAIFLQAMASTTVLNGDPADGAGAVTRGLIAEPNSSVRVSALQGTVQVGAGSVTAVRPSTSAATQLDAEVFNPSLIRIEGKDIAVAAGARVTAPSGRIELRSASNAATDLIFSSVGNVNPADSSRVVIAPGAVISSAGLADVAVDGARNQGLQRLFRIELADAPVQRTGPLYRSPVSFDLRDADKITAADVSGAAAAVGRTASERATAGGSISIQSNGAIVVGDGAVLDVAGGSVRYSQATIKNTLLAQDGRAITFNQARADQAVAGVLSAAQQTVAPAYTEGADGGALLLNGRQLVLAGQIGGQVTQGDRQRDGRSAAAAPSRLTVGQNDGTNYYIDTLALRPATTPLIDARVFADPLQAVLPGLTGPVDLSLAQVAAGGFGSLSVRAAHVTQPVFGTLDLGRGGALDIRGQTIALNGAYTAPGGSIAVVTPLATGDADATGDGDIELVAATRLDVAGRWTNDTAAGATGAGAGTGDGMGAGMGTAAGIQVDGGSVQVRSAHSLRAAPGVTIDASAGARLSASGSLTRGKAGSVALATGSNVLYQPELVLAGVTLRAFDFAQGGRLTLGAPAITLAEGSETSGGAGGSTPAGFTLGADFFSASGFGSIALNAFGDIRLASGTQIAPRLLTWRFADGWRAVPSGAWSAAVATPVPIDTQLAERKPVSVALAATRPLDFGGGSIVVERDAALALEPGGTLGLAASGSIQVGLTGGVAGQTSVLSAPGGAINLAITGGRGATVSEDPVGFVPEQALWLGDGARLSVSGSAQLRRESAQPALLQFGSTAGATPPDQRQVGTVLGGGSITLQAQRGYVVAAAGASLALDGAAATLNYPGLPAAVQVARAAGALTVSSPEGVVIDARVSAQPPRNAAGQALADGGRLNVALGAGGVFAATDGQSPYPDTPRTISVGDHDGLLAARGAKPGTDLTLTLGNGVGFVRKSVLQTAGFGGLQLAAGDVVRFDTALDLALPLGLQLNTPAIEARPGTAVVLRAVSAQLGDTFLSRVGALPDTRAAADPSATQDTRLAIVAPAIELVGNLGLRGFSSVALDAGATPAGEIRLSAVAPNVDQVGSLTRTLSFAGLLSLTAGQTYATSATQYRLVGLAATDASDPGSQLVVRAAAGGTPARQPLSALGSLTVSATDIDQGGTLRQPFGAISLQAERTLTLGEGSITSVSGAGSSLLFGSTVNLSQWVPGLVPASAPPIAKGISLGAAQIDTSATALVSAAGGGVLRASEFFTGVGGSADYFNSAGLYAVLPDYAATPALALNGGLLDPLQAGRELVVTLPGSGLAPGRYTLLPARFALLAGDLPQGAFVVSRALDQGGQGGTVLRAPIAQADGSVVVTGYTRTAGSATVGAPGERFVVEPAATFQAKSDIRLTDVSDLLASQSAALGQARPALLRDGGQVQVAASGDERSLWQARLNLGASGGQAGLLDMAATRLALLDDLARTPAGTLGVSARVIADSGAGSVLLGGQRRLDTAPPPDSAAAAPRFTIDQRGTQSVTVDLGQTSLSAEELLLAASGGIELAAGTRISSTRQGTLGPRTLLASGDGAMLAVSANALDVQRTSPELLSGGLTIGAGSALAGQQVLLDATGTLQIDSSVSLPAQALSVGARRIVAGAGAPPDPQATVLAGALLDTVRSAPDLTLRSYGSIDFVGVQNWAARPDATPAQPDPAPTVVQTRLVLDAPLIRGLAAADGSPARTDIAAQDMVLRNASGLLADAGAGDTDKGIGSLQLQALPPLRYGHTGGVTLGPGAVRLGFDSVALRSAGDIVLQGSGSTSAQQDLGLTAARLTAATGAQQAVTAGGGLRIGTEAGGRTLGERVGLGASLALTGANVQQDGRIDLPGGQLTVTASGLGLPGADGPAIGFGAGSSSSVAGLALTGGDGSTVYSNAGRISANAAQGRIDVAGVLDASAGRRPDGAAGEAGVGNAGSIAFSATGSGGTLRLAHAQPDGSVVQGQLLARAGSAAGDLGGRLTVDVDSAGSPGADADAVARAAMAGGHTRELSLRVRQGDVTLDTSVRAQRIALAADAGTLTVGGSPGASVTLDASAPAGGVVQLAAGNDLRLGPAASIDARSQRAGANGGDVLLASSTGRITLATAARVQAGGEDAPDGRIVLRALRGADNASVQIDRLDTTRLQAGAVDIEAVRVYEQVATLTANASGDEGNLAQSMLRADNNAFIANKTRVLTALGVGAADNARVNLRAGVEVRSDADLALADAWSFTGTTANPNLDRPGADAGFLTLRAAGNLNIDAALRDGLTAAGLANGNTRSWSYRLVAGADASGANPLSVIDRSAGTDEVGNLTVGAGVAVVTGAGSIEMAAGRDVVFAGAGDGSAAGLAFVAGRRLAESDSVLATLFSGQGAVRPIFTEQGGRLAVAAQRDVVAPEATQLVNNWFWRSGTLSTDPAEAGLYAPNGQLAWWTQFSRFAQTLGSFGGGNLAVQAGRDLVNVQALAPSAGWADSRVAAAATLRVAGGGDLTASAGRDLLGGQFFVGRGSGLLEAGAAIGSVDSNANLTAPFLALMDGSWRLAARSGVTLGGVVNPTAMAASAFDNRPGLSSYFYTWGPQAALQVVSSAGDVVLGAPPDATRAGALGLDTDGGSDIAFQVQPASLSAVAASGHIDLAAGVGQVLFPSASGQLRLWAGGSVLLRNGQLAMADSDPALWPQAATPATRIANPITTLVPNTLVDSLPLAGLHAGDSEPVRIHAGAMLDIRGQTRGVATLLLPKAAQLYAADDILELSLRSQHLAPTDSTSITAGRNYLAGLLGTVEVAGPGALEITAGRGVDLGSSSGISTSGNVRNAGLPAQGASVRLAAAARGTLDAAALAAQYLAAPAGGAGNQRYQQYRSLLLASVRAALQAPALEDDQALAAFRAFPAQAQAAFGQQVLAAEFGAVYLASPAPTTASMTATLQAAFDRHKADILQAGDTALAAGQALSLPGRQLLQGDALAAYLADIRGLAYSALDTDSTVAARVASLGRVQSGWRDTVARSLGGTVAGFDALAAQSPDDPAVRAYQAALRDYSGRRFDAYRQQVLASDTSAAAAAASNFGTRALPMRLALFDQGFQAAELAGAGSFTPQGLWSGAAPLLTYSGALDMTQSSVVTNRGGAIRLVNPGGAINVGLKDSGVGGANAPKGVIALGGGDIFGYAKEDFQVNTQRVFIVGSGNMNIWSSRGDIDSGRGANTAVAAPPLAARRSADGVLFEVPATTTGSGLGILEDALGRRSGTIGLYPALGEILALDAFIRAPSVVLGSTIKGADNLISASVGGAAAAVSAPALAVAPPPTSTERQATAAPTGGPGSESRPRNSLLTVELLGLGAGTEEECDPKLRQDGKCPKPPGP